MRRLPNIRGALAVFLLVSGVVAQAGTNAPPARTPASPIAYFRELLAMTEAERVAELAGRPESQRTALLTKVDQYAGMSASDRELRLRATELRYFLMPLMRLSPEESESRLESIPEDIRDLVEGRLVQWNLIPPDFRNQLLENQAALKLFSRMHPDSAPNADELIGQLPTPLVAEMEEEFARWQALTSAQRSRLLRGFNNFFQLTPVEQERTLRTLSIEERVAMEKTLRQFDSLPPAQRSACIQGFQQFMLMPPHERAKFMENVDRWQAMSPEDREEWRSVVRRLSQIPGVEPVLVQSPPLPLGFSPPVTAGTN